MLNDNTPLNVHPEPLMSLDVDLSKITSPALIRIVEEVRNSDMNSEIHAYDRVHNRHNR